MHLKKHLITTQGMIISFCLASLLLPLSFPGLIFTIGVISGSLSLWEEDTYILLTQYWMGVYSTIMFISLLRQHLKGNEINRNKYYPALIAGSLLSALFSGNAIVANPSNPLMYLLVPVLFWPTICAMQIFNYDQDRKNKATGAHSID
ncbi:MAG: hypothetical protein COW62_04355 [Zetaproteobacteria bacterium CG17_big_fil_post_rev_8_21_14_2_50_50_13]|nr:MAG: hypothetical protein AUJ56_06005 [Zetaproteobacteria bacterium CG1_02_49_23]PIQ33791.1 MAG: hypothetical protein COW62_04355 [Zetaproteobacteria bacterium CG17_big_fil_post_rev_8_21_14_2_50_50_13]PIY56767.1 MAG: hypothetical protein COZ00_02500 [Zetaproteobacteria bacterium CG_4_10_14_0_8_um_filter_49_80]